MVIDFAALGLGPAMAVFGDTVTGTPTASQPGARPFKGTGVFRGEPSSVQAEDGAVVATTDYSLGIRLADWAVPPRAEDGVAVAGFTMVVDRIHPDGQGGAILTLKRIAP